MASSKTRLSRLVAALERAHGRPSPPIATDPFERILLEHVAYLASDRKRAAAFEVLRERVGVSPSAVARARKAVLREVARVGGGVAVEERALRMKESARRVLDEWDGDLTAVLALPEKDAVRALRAFSSIGEPGAQTILLAAGARPRLALDSNGLRVLLRLGYGEEGRSYAASYRSAQAAAEAELPRTCAARLRAHQLLRTHGQVTCRNSAPRCDECPLAASCPSVRG